MTFTAEVPPRLNEAVGAGYSVIRAENLKRRGLGAERDGFELPPSGHKTFGALWPLPFAGSRLLATVIRLSSASGRIDVTLSSSPDAIELRVASIIGSLMVGVSGLSVVHPGTDLIEVEAPYAPDLEAGQIAALQKAVNCDAVYVEMCS